MKIALIHYRLLQKGGLERRLINYLSYFHELGHEVTVFATKKDPNLVLPEGVKFQRINLGLMLKPFRKLYYAERFEQIFAHEDFDFALSLGRTYSQPFILDGGNHFGYMRCLGYSRKSFKDSVSLHLERKSFGQAKKIFACSGFVRDFNIEGYQTDPGKIEVVYPPLNLSQFNQSLRPQRAELRGKFGIKDELSTFLFVSTGHKMKNLDFLLEVFEALKGKSVELLIAGTPPKRKLPANVRFLGYVSQPEELYTSVDYTIHPALYEPYGQVIAESVQCGTPVIVSQQVGAKEVISEKEGVIVEGFSVDRWVAEIESLPQKHFQVDPNWGEVKGLSLEEHVARLLQYV